MRSVCVRYVSVRCHYVPNCLFRHGCVRPCARWCVTLCFIDNLSRCYLCSFRFGCVSKFSLWRGARPCISGALPSHMFWFAIYVSVCVCVSMRWMLWRVSVCAAGHEDVGGLDAPPHKQPCASCKCVSPSATRRRRPVAPSRVARAACLTQIR